MNDNLKQGCPCECDSGCSGNAATACTTNILEYADVSIPLKIKPCAIVGTIETKCCGEPVVAARQCRSCNPNSCTCGCEITVTQNICIKIPVTYGVDTDIGEIAATCKAGAASQGGCCR